MKAEDMKLVIGRSSESRSGNASPERMVATKAWLEDLYTLGVEIKGDSVLFKFK